MEEVEGLFFARYHNTWKLNIIVVKSWRMVTLRCMSFHLVFRVILVYQALLGVMASRSEIRGPDTVSWWSIWPDQLDGTFADLEVSKEFQNKRTLLPANRARCEIGEVSEPPMCEKAAFHKHLGADQCPSLRIPPSWQSWQIKFVHYYALPDLTNCPKR